ncbi:MAG: 2-dehydropantoate 2-reductase N-terminal domain-containing protein [Acetobacter sp.]
MPAKRHSPPQLRIAVLGVGRIGTAFAFYLARNGGHEVTVIARPGSTRLAQVQRTGGVVTHNLGCQPVLITDQLDESISYDLVLVTVKDFQVQVLLPLLKRSAAKTIHFMFMTFNPEYLQQAIGLDRVALGMPFLQSDIDAHGAAQVRVSRRPTLTSNPYWASIFSAAGLPSRHDPQMALWLRCHVPLGVAFESVAVAAQRCGGGAPWHRAYSLACGIRACFALIRTQGYTLYPNDKVRLEKLPIAMVACMLWGLSRIPAFRTLLATGEAECYALIDAMVAALPTAPAPAINAIQAMRPAP